MANPFKTAFLELFVDPMVFVTGEGIVLAGNHAFGNLVGSHGLALNGRVMADLTGVPESELKALLIQSGRTSSILPHALNIRDAQGNVILYRARCAVYERGQTNQSTTFCLQLTPHHKATQVFHKLNHEIAALNKEIFHRVQAETRLRQSEEETKRARDYAEATLRTSPVPLLVIDEDFHVNSANEAFYQTFQVNSDETEGRLVYELGNGQWNIPKLRELLENILPQYTVLRRFEVTHDFESIGRRTMLLNARRMNNDSDRSKRIVLVIEDITERKQAEKALLDAKAFSESIISGSPFGLYVVDADFRIAQMNIDAQNRGFANVRPVIGRSIDEVMHILWPPDVAADIINIFRHTLKTGEPYYSKNFINPRRDKERIEGYEWELHRIATPDGRDGVVCYYFDTTALRDVERQLRESQEKLRVSAEQLEQRVAERTHQLAQSEERLRTMATELNLAEQRERKRLAMELHDHLQQTLVLGKLTVGQGKRAAAAVPDCLDVMKRMDDILSEALTYTRTWWRISVLSCCASTDCRLG
jgi:PAS domain S-box-containing protein